MSLSVKLFVKKSGSDEVEFRRISIDEDVSTSYDYLIAKIRVNVPSANRAAISLFWKGRPYVGLKASIRTDSADVWIIVDFFLHVQLKFSPI